jgi:hypothetical protein
MNLPAGFTYSRHGMTAIPQYTGPPAPKLPESCRLDSQFISRNQQIVLLSASTRQAAA